MYITMYDVNILCTLVSAPPASARHAGNASRKTRFYHLELFII